MDVDLEFFLGGRDLEMVTIRDLLLAERAILHDKGMAWGARASSYRSEIDAALKTGSKPVLVELEDDVGIGPSAIHIDHHADRAGSDRKTSLEQVFGLLGLPSGQWTRQFALVAANDRGWIPELRAIGATPEEIEAVRRADRAAQGITPEEEQAAARSVACATRYAGLIVVRLPHTRTAAVTDRLELAPSTAGANILVVSHQMDDASRLTELNFSGEGSIVEQLHREFEGGWWGGALPDRGYWGHGSPTTEMVQWIADYAIAQSGVRLATGSATPEGAP